METKPNKLDLDKKLEDVKSKVKDPKLVKAISDKQKGITKPFNK